MVDAGLAAEVNYRLTPNKAMALTALPSAFKSQQVSVLVDQRTSQLLFGFKDYIAQSQLAPVKGLACSYP